MQQENEVLSLYAVADIHGATDRLQTIKEILTRRDPHLLVIAGDILEHPGDEATIGALDELGVPAFIVPGNMDDPSLKRQVDESRNLFWIVSEPREFKGLTFVGVGAERFIRPPAEWEGEESLGAVLVSHRPPWGIQDRDFFGRHAGSRELVHIVERLKPILVICGHIHEDAGWSYLSDVPVVNCSLGGKGRGSLIEVRGGRISNVEMVE